MVIGFFQSKSNLAQVFILDSIRSNNMTNLGNLLNTEREKRQENEVKEIFFF